MAEADVLEIVIDFLIDTTPAPPTIAAENTHDAEARKQYADDVSAWGWLLSKRFRAARDLCEAMGVTVPWTVKTLDGLLGLLPPTVATDGGDDG